MFKHIKHRNHYIIVALNLVTMRCHAGNKVSVTKYYQIIDNFMFKHIKYGNHYIIVALNLVTMRCYAGNKVSAFKILPNNRLFHV